MSLQLHHQVFKQDNDAPWVVLIHGLFGNLDNLTVLRKPLAEQYNVITIDLPDHGESPHVDAFSLSLCVEGISALLDTYDIAAAHIVGHSLGGKAAMMTALIKPEKVLSLVVLDISPVNYPPHHQTIFAALKHVDLSMVTSRKDADQQLQAGIQEAGVRQFLLKSLYQNDAGDWQWRFNLTGLESNYTNISRFEAPAGRQYSGNVTFIKGGNSDYIKREHQADIAALFPNAKARIVEGTGHWLHAEKPQVVVNLVSRALQSANQG